MIKWLEIQPYAGSAFKFKAKALKVATRNAYRKNKVENEAKRFDPSEKIAVRRLRFARGQPR